MFMQKTGHRKFLVYKINPNPDFLANPTCTMIMAKIILVPTC